MSVGTYRKIMHPFPQDSVAVVSQLKRPWLALYPGTKHGVLMQQVASVLPLLDNFLAHA